MESIDRDLKAAAASLARERAAQTAHPAVEDLVAYHAKELTDTRTEEMREHLAACRECGDLVLELWRIESEERRPGTVLAEWIARAFDAFHAGRSGTNEPTPATVTANMFARRVPALAAAAAALLLVPGAFIVWNSMHDITPPLGMYLMEMHGDIKATRGTGSEEGDEPFRFAPGMTFDLNLYPVESVEGEVEVVAFRANDGKLQRWSVPIEISDEGAVRISGRVGTDITLPSGPSTVLVALGRRGAVPEPEEVLRRLSAADVVLERDWTAWRLRVAVDEGAVHAGPEPEESEEPSIP